jgi:lipopolysaccharide/colanic/teichoic acid biosynthesis glycosyltransferase
MKRLFDIAFSLLGLILISPVLLTVACLIKKEDKGPAFYRGVRVGFNNKSFRIFKFRTMVVDAEQRGASSTFENDPRITKIGFFLRKFKLDELPQLINVLRGEMSIVGPRPQVPWAIKLYSDEERKILTLRPGITDWASIRFPNEEEILKNSANPDQDYLAKIHTEKMRLALKYYQKHNLCIDIRIIILTLRQILRKTSRAKENGTIAL